METIIRKIINLASGFFQPALRDYSAKHVGLGLGLAGLSLGQALQSNNGFINVSAIFFLTIALMCLGHAILAREKPWHDFLNRISFPVLVLGLLLQISQLALTYVGDYKFLSLLPTLWQFRLGVAGAGLLAILSLLPQKFISPIQQNLLTGITLLVFWLLGTWVIKNAPTPFIDVFVFHQTSSAALLHGTNPYLLMPPNIYGSMEGYGAELVRDGYLTIGNPYPPLSISVSTLGYLAGGDIRYSHLFAIVLSGALIAFLHPGRGSKLAAYIFLFSPRSFYVVEQSWTEPIVILFLTASVYCAIHHPRWLTIMVGLLFASKQYLLFIFPLTLLLFPLGAPWQSWIRRYGEIALVAVLVTLPLALWDFPSFLWNVGEAQWYQVFRLDALSYLAVYARIFDSQPSQLIGFAALAVAFYFVWRFIPRTPTGFAAAFAWCLGIFFAFNKQAFCNYYFLGIAAICCTLSSISSGGHYSETENPTHRSG